jgi:hypothetical protein
MLLGKRRVRRGRIAKLVELKQRIVARLLASPPPPRRFEPRRDLAVADLLDGRARGVWTGGDVSLDALVAAREASRRAIVAVDMVVHPLQLQFAAGLGADAVLLVARAVDPDRFEELVITATRLGLEPIAEIASLEHATHARNLGVVVGAISEVDRDHTPEEPGAPQRFTERTEALERALESFEVRVALEAGREGSPWSGARFHSRFGLPAEPAP